MSLNKNLNKAQRQKNDEFYTQLSDIENELRHYTGHFRGQVVYCNCDDPRVSKFFHYFSYNFERLGLNKLITACYRNQERDLFSRHDSERAILGVLMRPTFVSRAVGATSTKPSIRPAPRSISCSRACAMPRRLNACSSRR